MTTKNKKKELKKEQNLEELMPTVEKTEIVDETKWEKIRRISKDKYNEIVIDLKNPIKRAVMRRKTSIKLMSILRGFIFIGLSFVIVFPIFQEISLAFKSVNNIYDLPIDCNITGRICFFKIKV